MSSEGMSPEEVRKAVKRKETAGAREASKRPITRPAAQMHDDNPDVMHVENENGDAIGYGIDLENEATEWRHFSNLQAPDPRPGYAQRWIRVKLAGRNDSTNVSKKFREGWRPRKISSIPEGHTLPTVRLAQFGLVIGVDDVVLCEMPAKVKAQRDAYYAEVKRRQNAAIETRLEDFADRGGIKIMQDRRSSVSRREPTVADD